MQRTLNISDSDWHCTPAAVKTILLSLHHEAHSVGLRALGYQKQIELLHQPAAHLAKLRQQITRQQKRILRLEQQITEATRLSAEVIKLTAENADLKEKLGQNSTNSSLSPSSDSPFRKKKNKVQPSGLKQGAQSGHSGRGRYLLEVDEVDRVVELRPTGCSRCGCRVLDEDWLFPARRQVTEITAVGTQTTEYQRPALRCVSCGKRNRAAWTTEAANGAFGARVQATVGYFTGRLNLSHRDTIEAMGELFGIKIGLGSVSAIQRRISGALARPVAQIRKFVENAPIAYVDETSWREQERRPWLWVKSTKNATVFQILDGRSAKDARTIIGESATGIITTDRYPGYNWIPLHHRQTCWAHLKRDFAAISERGDESKVIGAGLLAQTKRLFDLWRRVRDGTITRAAFLSKIEPLKGRVSRLLIKGVISAHSKTANTCGNILKLEYSLWTFTRIEGVEPTNNQAERALRRAVLWRRKSFGTQSESGSRFVERILTVVTTLRQQGRSVLEYLTAAGRATVTTAVTIIKNCEELNLLPSIT